MVPFKKFDFILFGLTILILSLGSITVGSVASENLPTHLVYIAISFFAFFLFSFVDIEIWFSFSPFLYLLSLFLLLLPFFFGEAIRGSARWINIGNLTFQPAELVKPLLAIFLAWFWSKKKPSIKNLFLISILFLPQLFLIFIQPDLGSTLAVLAILGSCLFSMPFTKQQLIRIALVFLIILPLGWFSLKDYQKQRIHQFLDPYSDPLGSGYNLIQAKISVGSGKLFGRGFGHGTQSHLYFLPERYTDFAFASFAEEGGFLGVTILLFLYFSFFWRILTIGFSLAENRFSTNNYFVLLIGIFSYIFFQTIVNIGMNIGLFPITGVTLPLFSYGGSSLLSTMISLGILENIAVKSSKKTFFQIH